MSILRILLADDHRLFRTGIIMVLQDIFESIEIQEMGSWNEVRHLVKNTAAHDIDLALLDLDMPGSLLGWEAELTTFLTLSQCKLCVISALDDAGTINKLRQLGVHGYIKKVDSVDIMKQSLHAVMNGERVFPSSTKPQIKNELLTKRQIEILQFLQTGLSNREIAVELGIAEATIKRHLHNIFHALSVSNRTSAIHIAQEKGLI